MVRLTSVHRSFNNGISTQKCSFCIEVSVRKNDWEMVVDVRDYGVSYRIPIYFQTRAARQIRVTIATDNPEVNHKMKAEQVGFTCHYRGAATICKPDTFGNLFVGTKPLSNIHNRDTYVTSFACFRTQKEAQIIEDVSWGGSSNRATSENYAQWIAGAHLDDRVYLSQNNCITAQLPNLCDTSSLHWWQDHSGYQRSLLGKQVQV